MYRITIAGTKGIFALWSIIPVYIYLLILQHINRNVAITMQSHYKRIDFALLVCYSYSRNRVVVGGGINVKYDSGKSR